MKLYIDLNKAVSYSPNFGSTTRNERQSVRSYKESYAKQPVGVMGGGSHADDPDEGNNWKHSEDSSVDAELEKDREEEEELNQERGVIPEAKKSLSTATDIVKSLNGRLSQEIRRNRPLTSEQQFLVEVMGADESLVRKGLVAISGPDRHAFHEWLCDRFTKSVASLKLG